MTVGEERDHFGYDPVTDTHTDVNDKGGFSGIRWGIILCVVIAIILGVLIAVVAYPYLKEHMWDYEEPPFDLDDDFKALWESTTCVAVGESVAEAFNSADVDEVLDLDTIVFDVPMHKLVAEGPGGNIRWGSSIIEAEPDVVESEEMESEEVSDTPAAPVLTVDDYLGLVPDDVREAFRATGFSVVKMDRDLGTFLYGEGGQKVLGATDPTNKVVYIDQRDCANAAILHELGHVFDFAGGGLGHGCDEFLGLYGANWRSWWGSYGMDVSNYDTPLEGYAQCFEIYFLKPECLDEATRGFISSELARIVQFWVSNEVL